MQQKVQNCYEFAKVPKSVTEDKYVKDARIGVRKTYESPEGYPHQICTDCEEPLFNSLITTPDGKPHCVECYRLSILGV